jgi:hypothetical protein
VKLLRKLMDSLGSVWNKSANETNLLSIVQNTGTHTMVTISEGSLYFHSVPFRNDLPVMQIVDLQNMTVQDLINTVNGMGYTAALDPSATDLTTSKAYILMEVESVPLSTTLQAFTSMTWKIMYPIYRILRGAEGDIELSLKQLYAPTASGSWLDYWATFFSIKREAGEADNDFIRRFLMWLFNPKTNNVALQELLAYRLKDNSVQVTDDSPGKFKVTVDQKYLSNSGDLNTIILEAKAAGIEYFLAYSIAPYVENYPIYASNAYGVPYSSLDVAQQILLHSSLSEIFPIPTATSSNNLSTSNSETYVRPSNSFGSGFSIGVGSVYDTSTGQGAILYDTSIMNILNDVVHITLTKIGTVGTYDY